MLNFIFVHLLRSSCLFAWVLLSCSVRVELSGPSHISVWSTLLGSISVCNEANPFSTNNPKDKVLIFLSPPTPPPPPSPPLPPPHLPTDVFHSEKLEATPNHLKLRLEINWKHRIKLGLHRNIQHNEIWMFCTRHWSGGMTYYCGAEWRKRLVWRKKSVYLRRLMVNTRKYHVCTCYV